MSDMFKVEGYSVPVAEYFRKSDGRKWIEVLVDDMHIAVSSPTEPDECPGTWSIEIRYAASIFDGPTFEEFAEMIASVYFSGLVVPADQGMGAHPLWQHVLTAMGFEYD